MKDPIPVLLLGLFIAFAAGYLVGNAGRDRIIDQRPNNYDPVRSLANDTIKSAQQAEQHCWEYMLQQRAKEIGH